MTHKESETQQRLLQEFIQRADRQIWQQPLFPQVHRPDIDFLLNRIEVGGKLTFPKVSFHPSIKPEIKNRLETSYRESIKRAESAYIAHYDPDNRSIAVSEQVFMLPQIVMQRCIVHELATDSTDRLRVVTPNNYSSEQSTAVARVLLSCFDKKKRPKTTDTEIQKYGFRELLYLDGKLIADLYDRYIRDLAEIYPTLVEGITAQLWERAGIVDSFETDIHAGRTTVLPFEDHPNFAQAALSAMKDIGWRTLLDAYKAADETSTKALLFQASPEKGIQIYHSLLSSMGDEQLPPVL